MKELIRDVIKWWLIIAGVAFAYILCREPIPKYTCYEGGFARLNRLTGEMAVKKSGGESYLFWSAGDWVNVGENAFDQAAK